jgi:cellobiose phosphorylase
VVERAGQPHFGSLVSESGSAYTWGENAHEFRLTPWHNDPVGDPGGEAIYLRDEETGQLWSPTPLPAPAGRPSRSATASATASSKPGAGIRSVLTVFVALDAAVKFQVLELTNTSGPRRLSVTGYVEWVLGDMRDKTAMHLTTEVDPRTGALCARNAYSLEFSGQVALRYRRAARSRRRPHRVHRPQRLAAQPGGAGPRAAVRPRGAGLDPCAAIQIGVELGAGRRGRSSSGSASAAVPKAAGRPASARGPAARRAREAVTPTGAHACAGPGQAPIRRWMCWPTAG